ncbi:MAG: hypothetical protein IPG10_18860 [Flavobacteriales bacterium]|nr:hypothetical protein [Flavobacteriales bacterium]
MRALRSLHISHWALALLLLFAAAAPSLSRMTCLQGGHSQLMLGDLRDCCPELPASDGPSIKAQCCVTSTAAADLAHFVLAQGTVLPDHHALVALLPAQNAPLPPPPVQTASWRGPPPLYAPARLARLQVLRI